MGKIVYVNKIPRQFNGIFDYVKDMLEYFYKELGLDCKIMIRFVESAKANYFEITDCMIRNFSEKNMNWL